MKWPWRKKVYEIKIEAAGWGGHQTHLHLSEGWEPFGVTQGEGQITIWFRRQVSK